MIYLETETGFAACNGRTICTGQENLFDKNYADHKRRQCAVSSFSSKAIIQQDRQRLLKMNFAIYRHTKIIIWCDFGRSSGMAKVLSEIETVHLNI